jgi:hypothetical protein
MALPFLFISFGNHQLSDHPAIADKQVEAINLAGGRNFP